MAKAVFCIVNASKAASVVDSLKAAAFSNSDISVLMPDRSGTKDFAVDNSTKAPEGAATGAGTGAVLGGGLGWLAGIGALAIPGLGPLIAAGPIMGSRRADDGMVGSYDDPARIRRDLSRAPLVIAGRRK